MTARKHHDPSQPSESADAQENTVRIVNCPQCGGDSVYAPSNPFRPFCSRRCKDIDFGAWADETFRVRQDADPDSNIPDDNVNRLQ